jgi:hypothetical protein
MARTAEEAARTLVHYVKLALGDQANGDVEAELASVVEDFRNIDTELASLRKTVAPMQRYGGARIR